jgi:hypothetical protein
MFENTETSAADLVQVIVVIILISLECWLRVQLGSEKDRHLSWANGLTANPLEGPLSSCA